MPSFKRIVEVMVAGMAVLSNALPAQPKLTRDQLDIYSLSERQNAAATAAGLNDVDILQFALTLEYLETAFYQQGFAQFSDSDFTKLGLSKTDLVDLKSIGVTEQTHVTTLLSAITATGTQPVAPCTYKFGFTDAAAMVATASTLENIGVSAYLGAAPLVSSAAVLGVAAQIVTVEARHQTFIRTASKAAAVPSAFDTPLGVRSVFSLAAAFIDSCPAGSNLAITPFAAIAMAGSEPTPVVAGSVLEMTTVASGASFCSFTNGGLPGGSVFSAFDGKACTVPQNLAGETYIHLTSSGPLTGVLDDSIVVAGPVVVAIG